MTYSVELFICMVVGLVAGHAFFNSGLSSFTPWYDHLHQLFCHLNSVNTLKDTDFFRGSCGRERGPLLRVSGNPPSERPQGRDDVWAHDPTQPSLKHNPTFKSKQPKISSLVSPINTVRSNFMSFLHQICTSFCCIHYCVFTTSFYIKSWPWLWCDSWLLDTIWDFGPVASALQCI